MGVSFGIVTDGEASNEPLAVTEAFGDAGADDPQPARASAGEQRNDGKRNDASHV